MTTNNHEGRVPKYLAMWLCGQKCFVTKLEYEGVGCQYFRKYDHVVNEWPPYWGQMIICIDQYLTLSEYIEHHSFDHKLYLFLFVVDWHLHWKCQFL